MHHHQPSIYKLYAIHFCAGPRLELRFVFISACILDFMEMKKIYTIC